MLVKIGSSLGVLRGELSLMKKTIACVVLSAAVLGPAYVWAQGGSFTIIDAIKQASQTNPGVGEASANRRATEAEMRQVQGTLLPQVRLQAKTGRTRFNQSGGREYRCAGRSDSKCSGFGRKRNVGKEL